MSAAGEREVKSVDDRRERLWRLVTERAIDSGWAGLVCTVAVGRLGVDATAVTVWATARPHLVAATDPWARALEELQYTVGEGPGVAAFTGGEPVLVADLGVSGRRWPGFGTEAVAAGVGAAFAFPLAVGPVRLGTLTLYRRVPAPLGAGHTAGAVALAELTTTALLADAGGTEVAPWAHPDRPGQYDEVNVASGLLAGRLGISPDDALLRLRAHAFSHRLPLTEVAQSVLRHRIQPDTFAG